MGYLSYFESGVGNHEVVEFSNFDLDFGKTQRGNEWTESCCTIEIDRTSASIRNSGPTTFSRT